MTQDNFKCKLTTIFSGMLDTRFSDLRLTLSTGWVNVALREMEHDLDARGIRFRPHWWLSDCWFSPDGVPGFAIPFCLAHPRLLKLEQQFMLEVDGGTPESCLRILRHETAHALASAYRLHLRQAWRRRFGRASRHYPESYLPRPGSRNYVVHLDHWYAQSHPAKDWAETFAVWLDPRSRWRERYESWPALHKLEYVDELLLEIRDKIPPVRTRRQVDAVNTLPFTLREYFEQKQARLRADFPRFHEEQLRRIFPGPRSAKRERASRFVARLRRELSCESMESSTLCHGQADYGCSWPNSDAGSAPASRHSSRETLGARSVSRSLADLHSVASHYRRSPEKPMAGLEAIGQPETPSPWPAWAFALH